MKQLIIQLEKNFNRADQSILVKMYLAVALYVLYFLSTCGYLWHIFFSGPEKSFAMLNAQNEQGVWQASYYQHRKFRHNVRFGSVSLTLLLVAFTVSINFIFSLVLPIKQVTFAQAEVSSVNPVEVNQIKPLVDQNLSVTTLNDVIDAHGGNCIGLNKADLPGPDGLISLREAICLANNSADKYDIHFSVNGVIKPNSNLPPLTGNQIIINGENRITLDGALIGANAKGFNLKGKTITIRNLTIQNFSSFGVEIGGQEEQIVENKIIQNGSGIILLDNSSNNSILSNYIGNDGTQSFGNLATGVSISVNALNNTIANNIIGGNKKAGIKISAISGTVINNNYIGVLADGTNIANLSNGIEIDNTVTGININENVIGANVLSGILCAGSGAIISSNNIGVFAGVNIGNHSDGITVTGSNNIIGDDNTIADNWLAGVLINTGTGNQITKNTIYSNVASNIQLINNGNKNITAPAEGFAATNNSKMIVGVNGTGYSGAIEIFASVNNSDMQVYLGTFSVDNNYVTKEVYGDFSQYNDVLYTLTDNTSNTSVSRVFTLSHDLTAPVTTADPVGGTFDEPVTVSLSSVDEAPQVSIFYSLDGQDPDFNSAKYTEPITMPVGTTILKFFGYDQLNTEIIQTETYHVLSPQKVEKNILTDKNNWQINKHEVAAGEPSLTDLNPTIIFKNATDYIGQKIKIIIKEKGQEFLSLKREVKENGRAKFLVNLDIGHFTLHAGFADTDETYTVTDFEITNEKPVYKSGAVIWPKPLEVASTADQVTLFIKDLNGQEIVHAISNNNQNGRHVLNLPFWPDPGQYIIDVTAKTNDTTKNGNATNIILTPNTYVSVFNTVQTDEKFYYRLTTTNQPIISGLSFIGQKVLVAGQEATYNCETICNWQVKLADINTGLNTLDINIDGQIQKYAIFRVLPGVIPLVGSHPNGYAANQNLLLTILGSNDDVVHIYKNNQEVKKCTLVGGTCQISTASFADYGKNTITLRALENNNKWSGFSTFTFTLNRPASYIAPAPAITTPIDTAPVVNETPVVEPPAEIINNITEQVQNEYNNVNLSKPPENLPYLTQEKEKITAEQKQALTDTLTATLPKNISMPLISNGQSIMPKVLADGSLLYTIVKEVNLLSYLQNIFHTSSLITSSGELQFTGQIPSEQIKNLPAYATLIIYSQPIVQIAQADENGRWTITVPLEMLPPGQHTAYVQTEVNGVKSDQVELVKFAVDEKVKLSKTAWLVIINILLALVILISLIIRQLYKNKNIEVVE